MSYRLIIGLLYLSLLSQQALAQNETSIKFQIKNFGMNVSGSFSDFIIRPHIDLETASKNTITAEVKVTSISTNNNKRDSHLRSEDYFEVSKYPTIKLKSTAVKKVAEGEYKMTALLTIKQVTKRIEVPLDLKMDQNQLRLKANFSINRRDFDVGGSSWVMSDTVKITVVYTGPNAAN